MSILSQNFIRECGPTVTLDIKQALKESVNEDVIVNEILHRIGKGLYGSEYSSVNMDFTDVIEISGYLESLIRELRSGEIKKRTYVRFDINS